MIKIVILIAPNGVGEITAMDAFMQHKQIYAYIESDACSAIFETIFCVLI